MLDSKILSELIASFVLISFLETRACTSTRRFRFLYRRFFLPRTRRWSELTSSITTEEIRSCTEDSEEAGVLVSSLSFFSWSFFFVLEVPCLSGKALLSSAVISFFNEELTLIRIISPLLFLLSVIKR